MIEALLKQLLSDARLVPSYTPGTVEAEQAPAKYLREHLMREHDLVTCVKNMQAVHGADWTEEDATALLLMLLDAAVAKVLHTVGMNMLGGRAPTPHEEHVERVQVALTVVSSGSEKGVECPMHGTYVEPGTVCEQCVTDFVENRPDFITEEEARETLAQILSKVDESGEFEGLHTLELGAKVTTH